MRFGAPHMLWALLALPAFYLLILWDERRRRARLARFADETVWKSIVPEADWGARPRKARVWLFALVFACLALARPQWGSHEEVVHVTGLDILTVLDVSNSMDAEDVIPSRLQKAKHEIRTLADRVSGDRMGLVAFAASAFLACPLTTDLDYMLETAQVLTPKSVSSQGTDIGVALDTARRALDRGAEEADPPDATAPGDANPASGNQPTRVVLLISDGEDQEDGALDAARKLNEAGIRLFVVGVGTQKGAPIPLRDDAGVKIGFKHDRRGEVVVSHFQPDALVALAGAGGGRYWNATNDEGEVDDLVHELGGMSRGEYAERRYLVYEERFQWPLALAVLLLFIELSMPVRRVRREALKREAPISGGVPVSAAVALALLLLGSSEAQAKQPAVNAYLENQKGVKAYTDGNMDEAKRDFGEAQAIDPSLPELDFNHGVIQLQEGDMDGAIEAFGRALQDPKLAGRAEYNRAIALGKKGDYRGAIRAYLGAINQAKNDRDESLEADSRKNIELLMQQRQEQKSQGGKGKQDQNQKQSQNQNQQQQQQSDQNQQQQDQQQPQNQAQQQNQPKHYQDAASREKQFKSQKLSREDADRVMSALTSRDRELQNHFNRQVNNSEQGIANDW